MKIIIICYHYAKQKGIIKIENNEFKKVSIKNCMCYFDNIIKLEDFDLDNILIDKKPYENILIYNISYKALIDRKPLCI